MDENNVYHTSSLYNFINEKNGDRLALNWNQNLELEFWKLMFLRKYTRTGDYQKLTVSPVQELDIGFHFLCGTGTGTGATPILKRTGTGGSS